MEGVRKRMLQNIDLSKMLTVNTAKQIGEMFLLKESTIQNEANRQLRAKNILINYTDKYEEFDDPQLDKVGAWMDSSERIVIKQFKNL